MAEYVEREKVLSKAAPVEGCFSEMISAYDVIMLPAADVALVVHGEWEQRPNGEVVCSKCGALVAVGNGDALKEAQESQHFCFNCGAKMDGDADND